MTILRHILLLILLLLYGGCRKMLETPVDPVTGGETVYASDAAAAAVLTGLYYKMSEGGPATGEWGLSYICGLSADEFTLHKEGERALAFYKNEADPTDMLIWTLFYQYIRYANTAIEGLTASTKLTPSVKQQLLGEARFVRAFCYFYLVNLFGDVPLQVVSDYKQNSKKPRTPSDQVYQQIITDLQEAKQLLNPAYLEANVQNTTTERVRPNKWAATALLARVYLFREKWAEAETNASAVIEQQALYDTVSVQHVFARNNKESIWQLQPVVKNYPLEADIFAAQQLVSASPFLLSAFEESDRRRQAWLSSGTVLYPSKYHSMPAGAVMTQYLVVLRLTEQYLIRAEARAQLGNQDGAMADLNLVRSRAGLEPINTNSRPKLVTAIFRERQTEFFAEWGHRWLDLKRSKNVNAVMAAAGPQKGGAWKAYKQWYPLLASDLVLNPNLKQNEGY
ncbi:RagB/SusD family nutrient uptake outer membrane protein [Chitinophaga tropicalis]|uniref:RagB/SusD family nutrient uptake outer membrane protein n=1 Tax=Chitinophaga tropicalis TaxID=2683588 RepID=A0A7K1U5T9_9BACT|nr:RagB/SusD family nutrient uptake outer membrane protein [Chitinophaga tropicalis]MVT09646.1 RagB/SusD family nutrient uptake outer membrane protein [Chitinophaga tropicalis]